jgi:rhamnopyranosyl-N-acetylglucosaminyl-diphospho-decaprenol beta-1,3/1,4-galactofuranosyltransferase
MKIAAAILHYRNWPEVRGTIEGVLGQTRRPDEVIVIDHASKDGSAQEIEVAYPGVRVVVLPENTGPAAGFAQLMRIGLDNGADAVLTVTDDAMPTVDALEHLEARLLDDERVGAATALIVSLEEPGKVTNAGGFVVPGKGHWYNSRQPGTVQEWEGAPAVRVEWVQLGFTLVRAQAAEEVGPYPRQYWHWGDDAHFSLEMRKRGWSLECVPGAKVAQHFGTPSEDLRQRNWLEVIYRTAPRRVVVRELARTAMWIVRDGVAIKSPDRRRSARMKLRGLRDFALRRFGSPSVPTTRKA